MVYVHYLSVIAVIKYYVFTILIQPAVPEISDTVAMAAYIYLMNACSKNHSEMVHPPKRRINLSFTLE